MMIHTIITYHFCHMTQVENTPVHTHASINDIWWANQQQGDKISNRQQFQLKLPYASSWNQVSAKTQVSAETQKQTILKLIQKVLPMPLNGLGHIILCTLFPQSSNHSLSPCSLFGDICTQYVSLLSYSGFAFLSICQPSIPTHPSWIAFKVTFLFSKIRSQTCSIVCWKL